MRGERWAAERAVGAIREARFAPVYRQRVLPYSPGLLCDRGQRVIHPVRMSGPSVARYFRRNGLAGMGRTGK